MGNELVAVQSFGILLTFVAVVVPMNVVVAIRARQLGYSGILWFLVSMITPPLAVFCFLGSLPNRRLDELRKKEREQVNLQWIRAEPRTVGHKPIPLATISDAVTVRDAEGDQIDPDATQIIAMPALPGPPERALAPAELRPKEVINEAGLTKNGVDKWLQWSHLAGKTAAVTVGVFVVMLLRMVPDRGEQWSVMEAPPYLFLSEGPDGPPPPPSAEPAKSTEKTSRQAPPQSSLRPKPKASKPKASKPKVAAAPEPEPEKVKSKDTTSPLFEPSDGVPAADVTRWYRITIVSAEIERKPGIGDPDSMRKSQRFPDAYVTIYGENLSFNTSFSTLASTHVIKNSYTPTWSQTFNVLADRSRRIRIVVRDDDKFHADETLGVWSGTVGELVDQAGFLRFGSVIHFKYKVE